MIVEIKERKKREN